MATALAVLKSGRGALPRAVGALAHGLEMVPAGMVAETDERAMRAGAVDIESCAVGPVPCAGAGSAPVGEAYSPAGRRLASVRACLSRADFRFPRGETSPAGVRIAGTGADDRDMSRVVPQTQNDRIAFYEARLDAWTANAAALGLDPAKVAELAAMVAAARADHLARLEAECAARAATTQLIESLGDMHELGSSLIQTIRARAAVTEDPGVYVTALIPAPDAPSPIHPEAPRSLSCQLGTDGIPTLTWTGSAKGGYFTVHRQVNGTGGYLMVGVTQAKSFRDQSLPAGTESATYQVRTHKGSRSSSPTGAILVRFTPEASPVRLAA